jgi:hypothetical protein
MQIRRSMKNFIAYCLCIIQSKEKDEVYVFFYNINLKEYDTQISTY